MTENKIGRLFEYSEYPSRFIVRLVDVQADESVKPDPDTGKYLRVTFDVVDPKNSSQKIGERFTVGQREHGPTYCWHASELPIQIGR